MMHCILVGILVVSLLLGAATVSRVWGKESLRELQFSLLRAMLVPLLYPMEFIWYFWSVNPMFYTRKLLESIVKKHENTLFGLKHNFSSIKNMNDYRKEVPLMESSCLSPYVEKIRAGENNILFIGEVKKYFLTSGTSSGVPSIIPCNSEELKSRGLFFGPLTLAKSIHMLGPATVFYRGMSALMSSRKKESSSEVKAESSLRAGIKAFGTSIADVLWTAPMAVNEMSDIETSYFLQWVFGLAYKNTSYIFDEYSSKFIYLVNVLLENHESIFRTIETGQVPKNMKIDSKEYKVISKAMVASPKRAEELRDIFEASVKCGHGGLLKALLPNLRYIGCIITGSFSVYEKSIRHYIGDTPIYNIAFGSSEAIVGRAIDLDDERYMLCPNTGIFEFIPQDKEEAAAHKAETKLMDELISGHHYEIVSTTRSGLYRLRTHDIIECTGFQRKLPCFRFLYRDGTVLNLCADNVRGDQLRAAMMQAQDQLKITFSYYTITVDLKMFPPGYRFFVELSPLHQEYATEETKKKLEELVHTSIASQNSRYGQRVSSGRISHPSISFVKEGCYSELEQIIYKENQEKGLSYGQVKIPTLLKAGNHDRLIDFVNSCRIEKMKSL